MSQTIGKIVLTNFVLGNIVILKTSYLNKTVLAQTFRTLHFNIPYYHLAKEQITSWKQNIQTLNHKVLNANKSRIATCFKIKSEKRFIHKNLSIQKNVGVPHAHFHNV